MWLSFWFGRAIVSATSEFWGWAHAHPVTKYVTAILGSVSLGAILTPQDMALLIILLVITCYLLTIPCVMLNVMRFLASKVGAFWTDLQPINTTLQHTCKVLALQLRTVGAGEHPAGTQHAA